MKKLPIKLYLLSSLCLLISLAVRAEYNISREYSTEYYKVEAEYEVVSEKVDPATFTGWNLYHKVCVGCHDVGGTGTDMAPDLTERIKRLTPDQFNLKVLHQTTVKFTLDDWMRMEDSMYAELMKQWQREKGELATMPKWRNNPAVRDNVDNIYRYLKARSDGVLGPDKPGIIKD